MKTKGECLERYAKKDPHYFFQTDAFYLPNGGDSVMRPDDDGFCIMSSKQTELMDSCPSVRVLIPPGTTPAEACKALKKIRRYVKRYLAKANTEHNHEMAQEPMVF